MALGRRSVVDRKSPLVKGPLLEREVKLVPSERFRLAALGTELPLREFVSTYHDTPGRRLARHGATLRHRLEEGVGLWQLELPRGASLIVLEENGPPARPPAAFLDLLPAYVRGETLVRIARLRTRRRGVSAEGAELVEDAVAVLEGSRIVRRFREIAVERTDGDEGTLERLLEELRRAGAEPAPATSELHRVLGLAPPERAASSSPDGARPLEVLRTALVEQHARLLWHDPGTRLGSDPEDLHQMRVATRRARAFLRAARPLLDLEWAEELRAELGWLGSALGPARDLDVLLEHIRGDLSATGTGERGARQLLEALEEESVAARGAVASALSSPRYLALLDRLERVEPVARAGTGGATLAELWWAEVVRTRKRFRKLGPSSDDAELHAARIQVKRARYAAELAGPELGTLGRRFVEAAKELQDVLGEHQDACVAEERIRAWSGREPRAKAVADRLIAYERRRRHRARERWPKAWAKVERRARRARP